ncbi:MAG: transcriptional regulator NanR [Pseudomonadota bacterium]
MTETEIIERRKLYHEVLDRLLLMIEHQGLKPGDALPSERELMDRYGVGRPAVREAMQSLARMGIVAIQHGERTRIAEPAVDQIFDQIDRTAQHLLMHSPASLEHLKEARTLFEEQMVRRAATEATPSDCRTLEQLLSEHRQIRDDPVRFLQFDGQFHREIANVSGNPIYTAVSQAFFGWLSKYHISLVRVPGLEHLTLEEHGVILDAIRNHDVDAAVQAMRDHLLRANRLYRQSGAS